MQCGNRRLGKVNTLYTDVIRQLGLVQRVLAAARRRLCLSNSASATCQDVAHRVARWGGKIHTCHSRWIYWGASWLMRMLQTRSLPYVSARPPLALLELTGLYAATLRRPYRATHRYRDGQGALASRYHRCVAGRTRRLTPTRPRFSIAGVAAGSRSESVSTTIKSIECWVRRRPLLGTTAWR